MRSRPLLSSAVAALAFLSAAVQSAPDRSGDGHWVDTWASMPQLTEPANLPPAPFNTTGRVFRDTTLRQTLHISIGARKIRLRFSNAFGGSDLPLTAVTVALPGNGTAGVSTIQTNTIKTVTFSGEKSIVIPNGALAVSDPIDFKVAPNSNIAVTIYTQEGQTTNSITSHPGSRTTSWMCFGNFVNSADLTGESKASTAHWYFVSAVEAWAPAKASALVIVGDSITDGRGSTTDGNNRWPDLLFTRMQKNKATKHIGIANQAAGGNRILADGLGPNALGRIDRDVLAQSGVRYALIFEGVNDIGAAAANETTQKAVGDRLIWAYKQMAERIRTAGIPVFAATITPFSGDPTVQSYSSPIREATRQRVNEFIRNSRTFDAVIDFDAILRDPAKKDQLAKQYDTGDYLHPNVAGFQAIADQFPLDIFEKFAWDDRKPCILWWC